MNDHRQNIRDIVEEIRARHAKGEEVSIAEIASAHPELMPELEAELEKLQASDPAPATEDDVTMTTHPSVSDSAATMTWPEEGFRSGPRVDIPDFELLSRIGSGGFGEVWVARHRLHGEFCALKLVYHHSDIELSGVRTYRHRAKDHPGLVPIEYVGEIQGCFYYVMPLADDVKGSAAIRGPDEYEPKTLEWCQKNLPPLPVEEVIQIGLQLLDAIATLHRSGLAHQDIKPGNVMMFEGRWRLGDLGLLSRNDQLVGDRGTLAFWPPEGTSTPIADLYALGKTLFLIVTGERLTQFTDYITGELSVPGDPELTDRLREVIANACHDDLTLRFRTAEEMKDALLANKPTVAPAASLASLQPTPSSATHRKVRRRKQSQPKSSPKHASPKTKGNRTRLAWNWSWNKSIFGIGVLLLILVGVGVGFRIARFMVMSSDRELQNRDAMFSRSESPRSDDSVAGASSNRSRSDGVRNDKQEHRRGEGRGGPGSGLEISGALRIACFREEGGPQDRRERQLQTLPSPLYVGDRLEIHCKFKQAAPFFLVELPANGEGPRLVYPDKDGTVPQRLQHLKIDREIRSEDVASESQRLFGYAIIIHDDVCFREWRANCTVDPVWNSAPSNVGWKYDYHDVRGIQLIGEDAYSSPDDPQPQLSDQGREAAKHMLQYCKQLERAPNSRAVWVIVTPCENPNPNGPGFRSNFRSRRPDR